ncbi:TrmH family RNA methyltransferase [Actinomadura macrotermitis]|uniref:23S rRNA (Guanosine-2'-O-)-methyltransferase RlmB n=1 Tax=Actinomadura macrotermitis TaxID=2585200 RepID=A0A7K0C8V5_9ACTN|nr:RNA methyltransferase [Actinomadura macrotermitis]MQY09803.1 23S rRNA (guanosine-2'-O-)-methyltransferase RlmB [Actinomadura macrotermitis]
MAGRELTSLRSPRVKAARRLAKRTFRHRERRFLAEGPQAVREALRIPGGLTELFTTAEAENRHADLVQAAEAAGVPVLRVSGEVMAELAQTVTPQGLLAVCGFVDAPLATALAASPRLVTVLAHVRDPGNAGTVLRTADAAGSESVVFTDASVDPYNGKCVRASAGSLFHLPVVVGPRFDTLIPELKQAGLTVLAADGAGERTLDEAIDDGTLAKPTAWVFGNEAWGLPEEILRLVDDVVRVPIHGHAESLNLATAAAVCLYASARAQRA